MFTIYKYELEVTTEQIVNMPLPAQFLSVQLQNGKVQLWALVDPEWKSSEVKILIYGTGHPIPYADINYISTFQMSEGALVFHVFQKYSI